MAVTVESKRTVRPEEPEEPELESRTTLQWAGVFLGPSVFLL
jgi:hypothetical protein